MPKQAKMLPLEELRRLLAPAALPLPAFPRVEEIVVEEYVDWTGDDSLRIYVIVEDAAPEDETIYDVMKPIYAAIQAALDRAGEARFPYMRVRTRAEYEARDNPDPDEDE